MILACLRGRLAAIVVAAPLLLSSGEALAQHKRAPAAAEPTTADKQAAARVKAEQGLKLFGAGQWDEAYEAFHQADALFHAPTLALYMARCQRQAGKLIEARATYGRLVAEPVPADAPPAFVEAHTSAKNELEKLLTLIPRAQFVVVDVPRASVELTLDGAPLAESSKELNPGPHTLEIRGGANEHNTKSFVLVEGPNPKIEILLRPPPPAGAVAAPPPPGPVLPGALVLGIGGAALVAGAVTGGLTLSKASAVKAQCMGIMCPASVEGAAHTASTLGNVSNAMFIAGGVLAATGAVLLIVRPRFGQSPPQQAGIAWSVGVGAGRFELGGRF
jgi:hypothetical protein